MVILLNGQTMQKFKLTIKYNILIRIVQCYKKRTSLTEKKKNFSHQVARTEIVSRE